MFETCYLWTLPQPGRVIPFANSFVCTVRIPDLMKLLFLWKKRDNKQVNKLISDSDYTTKELQLGSDVVSTALNINTRENLSKRVTLVLNPKWDKGDWQGKEHSFTKTSMGKALRRVRACHFTKISVHLFAFSARIWANILVHLHTWKGLFLLVTGISIPSIPPAQLGHPITFISIFFILQDTIETPSCLPILVFSELILYLFSLGLSCHVKHGSSLRRSLLSTDFLSINLVLGTELRFGT